MVLETLEWGSVIAIALGVVVPILFAAALKIFTNVDAALTSALAVGSSWLVLDVFTLGLAGIALWGGPFLFLLVVIGGLACFFVTAATVVTVGLVPRAAD